MRSGAVVVIGSVNVDLVVQTPHLPSPGETVIGGTFLTSPGGKGANAAVAAARLGVPTWIIGLVGPDTFGEEARRDLGAGGVNLGLLGTGTGPTGVAAVLVDEEGGNLIAVASGANAEVSPDGVREAMARIDAAPAAVLANLEVPGPAVAAGAEAASERGWPFLLNPAPARPLPPELLARCAVVVANQVEAARLGAVGGILRAGAGAAVVTRGEEGADLYRSDRPPHHQPPFPVPAADTTGAGDAFAATLAVALVEDRSLEDGVRLAAVSGALACRRVGARAGLPDRAELERFLSDQG